MMSFDWHGLLAGLFITAIIFAFVLPWVRNRLGENWWLDLFYVDEDEDESNG